MIRNTGISNTILDHIGNTPLIKLNKITKNLTGNFYVKYEGFNPGHSMKDRISLHIIEEAERQGLLKEGSTIIETTSGNTGFSMALVSIIKGYKCVLAVSSKASIGKINMLKAMGAKVYVCPAHVKADDPRSYYQVAKRLHEETANSIYINQYFNQLNIDAHYNTTGPEIWEQTNGEITHLIAASGTGGTISGVSRYLKEQNPDIKVLGVDAFGSILKKFHETGEFDHKEIYPYRIEGLGKNLIPYTSGAVLQAAVQYDEKGMFDKKSNVVLILPDHGSRYMEKIYSDEWMREQGFFDAKKQANAGVEYVK